MSSPVQIPDSPAASVSPLVRGKKLTKRFGALVALDRVDFELLAGEVHGLVGANGAGKSTLVGILSGAIAPDEGRLDIGGEEVEAFTPAVLRRAGVRTIHQERQLCPDLSVAENIHLGDLPRRRGMVDWPTLRTQSRGALARLGAPIEVDRMTSDISRAEQQVVEVARAVQDRGRILLMDEPTAALSHSESRLLLAVVDQLRAAGTAIVYISHNLSEVLQVADRVTVLRDGRRLGTYEAAEMDSESLGAMLTGNVSRAPEPARVAGRGRAAGAPPLLTVRDLTLNDRPPIDLRLMAGEIVALTGLLGAGHLEVGLAIFGEGRPIAGSVEVDGKRLVRWDPSRSCRSGIGLVPPDRKTQGVLFDLSIAENTLLPRVAADPPRVLTRTWLMRTADRVLAPLNVKAGGLDAGIGTLSGGNQQKVVFGKWLATHARVLILAEPTSGVDVGAKEELCRVVEAFVDGGGAVLLLSSDFEEVERLADRALVFNRGRIVAEFAGSEVTSDSLFVRSSEEYVGDTNA
jgi:ribose transport system ATP-binding protein